jgi:hypothetical protein
MNLPKLTEPHTRAMAWVSLVVLGVPLAMVAAGYIVALAFERGWIK